MINDLISRQAAIRSVCEKECRVLKPCNAECGSIIALRELPSVEAEPVVRCKDCKHRYIDGENVRYNVCDLNHNKVQGDDWYCADGERKDG